MPAAAPRIVVTGLAAAMLIASAANAFAIRNRYTNENNEGFTALLFEGFAPFDAEDSQPLYRPRSRFTPGTADGRCGSPCTPYNR